MPRRGRGWSPNRKPNKGASCPTTAWAQVDPTRMVAMCHGHSLSPAIDQRFQPCTVGCFAGGQLRRLHGVKDTQVRHNFQASRRSSSASLYNWRHTSSFENKTSRCLRFGHSRYLYVLLLFDIFLDDRQRRPPRRWTRNSCSSTASATVISGCEIPAASCARKPP